MTSPRRRRNEGESRGGGGRHPSAPSCPFVPVRPAMAGRDRPGSAITSAVAETPEERVARLEAELAQAKAEALQKELAEAREKELAEARAEAAGPPAPTERQPQPEV